MTEFDGTTGVVRVTVNVTGTRITGSGFAWCELPVIASDGVPPGEIECIAPREDPAEAERRAWDRKRRRLIRRVK